jgi:hypothetical protein
MTDGHTLHGSKYFVLALIGLCSSIIVTRTPAVHDGGCNNWVGNGVCLDFLTGDQRRIINQAWKTYGQAIERDCHELQHKGEVVKRFGRQTNYGRNFAYVEKLQFGSSLDYDSRHFYGICGVGIRSEVIEVATKRGVYSANYLPRSLFGLRNLFVICRLHN